MWRCFRATQTARARADEQETSKCKTDVLQNSRFSSLCRTLIHLFFFSHSLLHSSSFILLSSPFFFYLSILLSLSLSGRGLISEIGQDISWPISLTFCSVGLQRGSVPARKNTRLINQKPRRAARSSWPAWSHIGTSSYSITGTSHFEDLALTATAKLLTSNHTTSP